jgi:hypothetical protein
LKTKEAEEAKVKTNYLEGQLYKIQQVELEIQKWRGQCASKEKEIEDWAKKNGQLIK